MIKYKRRDDGPGIKWVYTPITELWTDQLKYHRRQNNGPINRQTYPGSNLKSAVSKRRPVHNNIVISNGCRQELWQYPPPHGTTPRHINRPPSPHHSRAAASGAEAGTGFVASWGGARVGAATSGGGARMAVTETGAGAWAAGAEFGLEPGPPGLLSRLGVWASGAGVTSGVRASGADVMAGVRTSGPGALGVQRAETQGLKNRELPWVRGGRSDPSRHRDWSLGGSTMRHMLKPRTEATRWSHRENQAALWSHGEGSWAKPSWAGLNWVKLDWIELSWADPSWAELSWVELNLNELSWIEPRWVE